MIPRDAVSAGLQAAVQVAAEVAGPVTAGLTAAIRTRRRTGRARACARPGQETGSPGQQASPSERSSPPTGETIKVMGIHRTHLLLDTTWDWSPNVSVERDPQGRMGKIANTSGRCCGLKWTLCGVLTSSRRSRRWSGHSRRRSQSASTWAVQARGSGEAVAARHGGGLGENLDVELAEDVGDLRGAGARTLGMLVVSGADPAAA